jgi:hypothetical protein
VTECVNPDHLEPVTQAENNRRAAAHRPKPTHCINGHAFSEENTYVRPKTPEHWSCKTCMHAAGQRYRDRRRAARNQVAA